ncbi:phosphatidate cytidylyltransferase, mitochondrial-like [Ylistrum balloti]|uniref:phosphatidate cytidylyltransferase, mitochondrial-like n=1 Tax=Ylistrum balloti TaxID=509963 RepID=UPI002905C345|nr:phosphatidate cytidylyltransferase, mitochondrial-like [Ylistrum balloti]
MAKFLYPTFGAVNPIYQKVVNSFPSGMQMAFAYGSGVFHNRGKTNATQNVLDFMIVVDDPISWHRQNIKQNANHYSFLKMFGPNIISGLQESSAGLYFSPIVQFEDRFIKYSVINTVRLAEDLVQWRHLYASGRLHKPVVMVKPPDDEGIQKALEINLRSAVHTSLMLLPETFSEVDLFMQVASLSYTNEIRISFSDDENKVKNIVNSGIDNFRVLYKPILSSTEFLHWNEKKKSFEQECDSKARRHHLNFIPENLLWGITVNDVNNIEDLKDNLANDSECGIVVYDGVEQIVSQYSISQSMKGLLTEGWSGAINKLHSTRNK